MSSRRDGWSANVGRDPAWWLGTIIGASLAVGAASAAAVGSFVRRHARR